MDARTVRLDVRTAPIVLDCDVVVCGGGSAGLAAAIAAARAGARVALIERYGFFGGNAVAAYVGTICGLYVRDGDEHRDLYDGFPREWAERLKTTGSAFGPVPYKETAVLLYVPWAYKRLADEMVRAEPNITPLLHATVTEVVRSGRIIDAVVVGSKRGPLAITAAVFVDASGDADLAFHAGCATETGGPGQRQFPSMQFLMENVDVQAAYAAGLDKLNELLSTIGQTPEWNLSRSGGAVLPTFRHGEAIGAMTRVSVEGRSPDMTDPFEAAVAEMNGRDEAEKAARFLIAHMPGFANAFIADTPPQLGIRETRRGVGDYVLTGEDVLSAAPFDDAVAAGAWPQEFHVAGKGTEYVWLEPGASYQVPYRALLARDADNLLLAGRCISATHEALASSRVIAPSMAQGEAAGRAAALAARNGTALRNLDARDIANA
ncbi:MAG TPA: FAD-dependent oxidoreductase [Actinomycetota bacterium]|nr:FAD-dependent oxidoreductase [Actinomycetota bacterium]